MPGREEVGGKVYVVGSVDRKKYARLLKDIGIFAVGSIGSKLILFLLLPLYTNVLTDVQFGIADLVVTIGQLIMPFSSLVIFDAVLRFGISKEEKCQNVLLNGLLVCCAGSVVVVLFTPLFGLYGPISEWRWFLSAYVILTMLNNVVMNYLKVKDRNRTYAFLSIFQTAVLALANILLLCVWNAGICGYLLSLVISAGANLFVASFAGRIWEDLRASTFQRRLLLEMLCYSAPLVLNNVSWWAIQSSEKVLIEAMLGASALGAFTVASKMPALINVIITIFSQAWGLSSVREFEGSRDSRFFSMVLNCYQMIGFGASIALIAIIKPLMSLYVGEGFFDSWHLVPFLLASASFSAISSYYGSLYGALKKSVNNMFSTLVAAIVNIIVSYFGIKLFGIWGAVFGTFAAYATLAIYRCKDVGRHIEINLDYRVFVCNIIILVAESVLVSLDIMYMPVAIASLALFFGNNWHMAKRMISGS